VKAHGKGFSIIELVIVVVIVAIAAVGIGSAFAYMSRSLTLNEDLQRGWQIAQECAEHIVGRSRRPGSYASVPAGATACDAIPQVAPYNRVVNIGAVAVGPMCLTATPAWGCKSVTITVDRGGSVIASLSFMLVNY
jgi:prepilin-type N-terminal cleavage/methylation domain-containing protein